MPRKLANHSAEVAHTGPEQVAKRGRRSIQEPTLNDIHLTRRRELFVADRDSETLEMCTHIAARLNCELVFAPTASSALGRSDGDHPRILMLDNESLSDTLRLLRQIQAQRLPVRVIVCSAKPHLSAVVEVIKAGAVDYLEKPLKIPALEHALEMAFAAEIQPSPVIPIVDLEREAIENAVIQAHGDKVLAAQLLGIGKTTLYRKLREYRRISDM